MRLTFSELTSLLSNDMVVDRAGESGIFWDEDGVKLDGLCVVGDEDPLL